MMTQLTLGQYFNRKSKGETSMEKKETFGKFIQAKRKEAGLTQKAFADELFVTESAVSKWERGVSYPDITLLSGICKSLNISEHELLIANNDYNQQKINRDAKTYSNIKRIILWIFNLSYITAIVTCFICNLAISGTLSWFFLVVTGCLLGFTLTSLPIMLKKHKCLITLGTSYVSLFLLLMTCCLYTDGDWFFITFIPITFGVVVIFLPFLLRAIRLPLGLSNHKTLICFIVDTILLPLMLMVVIKDYPTDKWLEIVGVSIILPWLLMIVIRYLKLNNFFKTAICLFISGIYSLFINGLIDMILFDKNFEMINWSFKYWNESTISGNVIVIIISTLFLLGVIFTIGGITLNIKGKSKKQLS